MKDSFDLILENQPRQEHTVEDVTLNEPVNVRFELISKRLNVHRHNSSVPLLTQELNQAMAYLATCSGNEHDTFSHKPFLPVFLKIHAMK